MSEQVTPSDEQDELASVLHENFNKARGRGGVSPALLADAVIAAGFRRVSPVTREALIRAIRVPVRWQGETPEEYMLDEDDAGMVADAIMPLLSASPPAEDEWITTIEQLSKLPPGAVVRHGGGLEEIPVEWCCDSCYERRWETWAARVKPPATVLWVSVTPGEGKEL